MSEERTNPESPTESTGAKGSEEKAMIMDLLSFLFENAGREVKTSKIALENYAAAGNMLEQRFHDGRVDGVNKIMLWAAHYAAFRLREEIALPDEHKVDLKSALTRHEIAKSNINRWMAISSFIMNCAQAAEKLSDIVEAGSSMDSCEWQFAAENIDALISDRYRDLFGCELGK